MDSSHLDPDEVARYARHIVLAEIGGAGQQRLKAARVLVIGAGGLGSPVLSYLAAAGVGLLGVIDDDAVSLSNLQRQILHDTANVGMAKTESAAPVACPAQPAHPGGHPRDAADGGQCGGCADRL
jgi:molybdopterin/thiamine biosynthesis adenylyltransferase